MALSTSSRREPAWFCFERARLQAAPQLPRKSTAASAAEGGRSPLGIRNFAQHRWPLRSSGRRNVRWPPVPRLVPQNAKSECFLPVRGTAKSIGEPPPSIKPPQFVTYHRHHPRLF